MLTASDYMEMMYPGRHMDRLFSICYLPTTLITLVICVAAGATKLRPRIYAGYGGFVLCMLALSLVR